MNPAFIVLTPTYRAAGGVIKIFDYVTHARSIGFDVVVHSPKAFAREHPIFEIERFAELLDDPGVVFKHDLQFGIGAEDFVFFSWPRHYFRIAPRITPAHHPLQCIAIVQGVRWANPTWINGDAVRVLGQPIARIAVTPQIEELIRPLTDQRTPTRMIMEGHDWAFFSSRRCGGLSSPIKVAYTTWKSGIGLDVQEKLRHDARFTFRSISDQVSWSTLRELYHWADVFLAFPGQEEGFYLPGIEAMAAGAIVVMPDVGGNLAYARFGANCIQVQHDQPDDYESALFALAGADSDVVEQMRSAGYSILESHDLARERDEFAAFVDELRNAVKTSDRDWTQTA